MYLHRYEELIVGCGIYQEVGRQPPAPDAPPPLVTGA